MNENQFLIAESVANNILAYLTTRPYKEVAGLVNVLVNLQPAPVQQAPVQPIMEVVEDKPTSNEGDLVASDKGEDKKE